MVTFGVDIGGTTTRAAIVDRNLKVQNFKACPTRDLSSIDKLIDWLSEFPEQAFRLNSAKDKPFSSTIGVAIAGIINKSKSEVVRSVHLPFLEGEPIRESLTAALHIPVHLVTDAQATTWGEYIALRDRPTGFAHLRFGTGVACGVIVNNSFVEPARKANQHANILIADASGEGRICKCGLRGCLETVASGSALQRAASAIGCQDLENLEISALREDAGAVAVIDSTASAIAGVAMRLADAYSVNTISIGGGVIHAMPQLAKRIELACNAMQGDGSSCFPKIVRSNLGDHAGVIGAAILAGEETEAA